MARSAKTKATKGATATVETEPLGTEAIGTLLSDDYESSMTITGLAANTDPQLVRRLSIVARLYGKTIPYIAELALQQWMESTGDLLIDHAVNKLPKDPDRETATVLKFPSSSSSKPVTERTKIVRKTHRHRE